MLTRISVSFRKRLLALLAAAGMCLAAGPVARADGPCCFMAWWQELVGSKPNMTANSCCQVEGRACPESCRPCCPTAPCSEGHCGTTRACCPNAPCSEGHCATSRCCEGNACGAQCPQGCAQDCPRATSRCAALRLMVRQCGEGQDCHAVSVVQPMSMITREQMHVLLGAVVNQVQERSATHDMVVERVFRLQQMQMEQMSQKMDAMMQEMQALHNEIQTLRNQAPVVVPMPYPQYPQYPTPGYPNHPYYPNQYFNQFVPAPAVNMHYISTPAVNMHYVPMSSYAAVPFNATAAPMPVGVAVPAPATMPYSVAPVYATPTSAATPPLCPTSAPVATPPQMPPAPAPAPGAPAPETDDNDATTCPLTCPRS